MSIRRRILATVIGVATILSGLGAATITATAVEPEYKDTPISGVQTGPGFEWVEETEDAPAHYSVSDPVPGMTSHETMSGWWRFAQASRITDFEGYLIVLDSNLDASAYDWSRENDDRRVLTVGSKDKPFKGTFDGRQHVITALNNERDGLDVVADCGLFGHTNQAVIKHLTVTDSYVGASYRGGLIVGSAKDTFLFDILCEDCTSSVIPGNNVISLITNAGLMGGMIAGEADGSTLYDCEMRGGRVVTNATLGVGALGGQPLYLGALVGACNDTIIEYSRVTDKIVDGERRYAQVSNRYETAVDVLQFSELFTGGIVGMMQGDDTGSKIVDSYSTADVYSYSKNVFGVGLGLGVSRGYTGGIAGIVREGGKDGCENLIERVSYAGNLHSYNYNVALLGIPAIEHDKYMGGITGRGGNNATIHHAYYLRSASSTSEKIYAYKTTYGGGEEDTDDYGMRDDKYTSRKDWEDVDFDMEGGTVRNLGYPFTYAIADSEWSATHVNKWVMDYNRGIPVHGGSLKATLDWPGSGTVTIGETGLASSSPQSTDNPYDFAVQGRLANDADTRITFTLNRDAPEGSSWDADDGNEGYRFDGWYRQRNVTVNHTPAEHGQFTDSHSLLADGTPVLDDANLVEDNTDYGRGEYSLTVTKPVGDEPDDAARPSEYADNDLYVARTQAQTLLHDTSGTVISKTGGADDGRDDDWYRYGQSIPLPDHVDSDKGIVSESATLIGWTDMRPYEAITSNDLETLKKENRFFEVGTEYAVTAPTNLYPVYSDYISNISVIMEGHERVAPGTRDEQAKRQGYGEAKVTAGENGHVRITINAYENGPIQTGAARFLGWYENVGDDSNPNWVLSSKDESYDLTASNVDLTRKHTYMARFEYKVEYRYWKGSDDVFATRWVQYNAPFDTLDMPGSVQGGIFNRDMTSWRTGLDCKDTTIGDAQGTVEPDSEINENWLIQYPMTVHGHWDGGDPSGNDLVATTDFPGAGDITVSKSGARFNVGVTPHDGYTFHRWTLDDSNNGLPDAYTSTDNPWDIGFLSALKKYWAEAAMTADVNFLIPDQTRTVQRRWRQQVFTDETDTPVKYHWETDRTGVTAGTIKTASATHGWSDGNGHIQGWEMDWEAWTNAPEGYAFVGWVETGVDGEDSMSQAERDWVFADGQDIGNGVKTVGHLERVLPYLLDKDEYECTGATTLMPVYAKIDVTSTTNIHDAAVPDDYLKPDVPGLKDMLNIDQAAFGAYSRAQKVDYAHGSTVADGYASPDAFYFDSDHMMHVKIGVERNPKLTGDGDDTYTLENVTLSVDGVLSDLTAGDDGTYTAVFPMGASVIIKAWYTPVPVTVTYHANGEVDRHTVDAGDPLPDTTLTPQRPAGTTLFHVGWTIGDKETAWSPDVTPATPGTTIVETSIDLYPVWREASITVTSNIDDVMPDHGFRRMEAHADDPTGLHLTADDVPGYRFDGWTGPQGQTVTTEHAYRLTGDARFDGGAWTAMYTKVREIRYHDLNGDDVLYTVGLTADDDRTFTTTVDGVETPIDADAFTRLAASIGEANGQDGMTIALHTLVTYKTDGERVEWEAFKNRNAYDMAGDAGLDIYPQVDRFQAVDPENKPVTDALAWTDSDTGRTGAFTAGYDHATITIRMDSKVTRSASRNEVETMPAVGRGVTIADRGMTPLADGVTGDDGTVTLTLTGPAIIRKTTTDTTLNGQLVPFSVTSPSGETTVVNVRVVNMSGESTLRAPFGTYTVREDTKWMWRHTPDFDGHDHATLTIGLDDEGRLVDTSVECGNTPARTNWFTGVDSKHNVMGGES